MTQRLKGLELQEDLMPEKCRDNIDLVHMDKGKIVTVGNYDVDKDGKRKDMFCLEMRYANFPYETTIVEVDNSDNAIAQFTVDHHWHKIKTSKLLRAASLSLIYGTRFDLAFKETGKCQFVDDDPAYDIKEPARNVEQFRPKDYGTFNVIRCWGKDYDPEVQPTEDKEKIIERATRKETKLLKSKSILNEFIDADKYPEINKERIGFSGEGGSITFTPFYFTEQWAFLRTSKQLDADEPHPSRNGDREHRTIRVKVDRILREIDFLMGTDEFSERSTLVDFEGKYAHANGHPIGDDPNTYPITKAFIDPSIIDEAIFESPRYGKARKVKLDVRPNTKCEIRTNFKRGRFEERALFCSNLEGEEKDLTEKAKMFWNGEIIL